MNGLAQMREEYGRLFAILPNLHAEIVSRVRVGSFVVDEERVRGRPEGELHAVAISLDDEGLIDGVRFLR